MVSNRRRAPQDSDMRAKLIEAATAIIREQGHGALTARTLADRLSLKRQILHYYFKSMDELLEQVVLTSHNRIVETFDQTGDDANPLSAIWKISSDPEFAILSLELAALAARRPAVREVVRTSAENLRALQTGILVNHLAARGQKPAIDPEFAILLISSISQTLAQETLVGIVSGHETARAIVNEALMDFANGGDSRWIRRSAVSTTPL